jgi:hypothetical protein
MGAAIAYGKGRNPKRLGAGPPSATTVTSGLGVAPRKVRWAMRLSSDLDRGAFAAPSLVKRAASTTPVMLVAISPVPAAASPTLRFISLVVAVRSSTADTTVVWKSLIREMTVEISSIAVTAPVARAVFDLGGYDRQARARITGPCCLDGGVEGEQVGLRGDRGDHVVDFG